jgi:fructokinase
MMKKFIGIEAGGTKFVCVYGSSPDDLEDRVVIKTRSPAETMKAVFEYIRSVQKKVEIAAIGAAFFGPLDLNPKSPTYGHVTTTPKTDWCFYDAVGALKSAFNLPVGFDTDVNGAALGEHRWGSAQGLTDFIYLTVGTGIGGGVMVGGELLHGAMHPEMGHILIPQDQRMDPFAGVCPYHHNCLEGLASGPAINTRWGVDSALDLPPEHVAWDYEAYYLGVGLANFTMCLSPQRIIMGGGVMKQAQLLPKIRAKLIEQLAGYIKNPTVIDGIEDYIVLPGLGNNSGVCGAIALAQAAYEKEVNHGK